MKIKDLAKGTSIKYVLFGAIFVIVGIAIFVFYFAEQPSFFDSVDDKHETEQVRIATDSLERALEVKDYNLCFDAHEPDLCTRTVARITGTSKTCKEIVDPEGSEMCIALVAGDKGNYDLCGQITDKDIKNYCQRLVAARTLNSDICEDLPNDLAPYTRDRCFFDMAAAKKSAALCEKSGGLKEECYYRLAVETQNLATCSLIKDNDLRDFCFFYNSVHVSQVRPCEKVERDPLAALCPALASLNAQYCELIKDYRLKNLCYRQIALKTNDAELCRSDRNCITTIASRTHSPELCDQISFEQYRSDCKTAVATANHDESICKDMDKNPKEYCFYYLALKTGDAAHCENIENKNEDMIYEVVLEIFGRERRYELTRSYCISQVARYKPDIGLCDNIRSDTGKKNCRMSALSSVIKLNKDSHLCESLDSFYDEIKCYYNTAVNTKNYQLCQKINEVKIDTPYDPERWIAHRAENLQECYDKLLFHFENEYLKTHAHIDGLSEDREPPEDPIVFTVQKGDVLSSLAEKALNSFLADMTELESNRIDFKVTLGHRVYIEAYLARQVKPQGYIYPGEKISFPRKLIMESIQISNQLTADELKYLSRYSISTFEPGFDLLQEGYLSYCDFKNEMSYHFREEDKDLDRTICQITMTGDYSLCEQVSGQLIRRECYKWIVENTSNYKVCENFQEQRNRNFCYDNFARSLGGAESCYILEDTRSIEYCFWSVAMATSDPLICELIKEDKGTLGACYKSMAEAFLDPAFCEKIPVVKTTIGTKSWCLINLAEKTHDVSLCEKIEEYRPSDTEDFKYRCYILYYRKNPTRIHKANCEELSGAQKYYCYLYEASRDRDPEKCNKIEIKEIKDYCLHEALIAKGDSRCHLIESQFYRNLCYSEVAQSIKDPALCNKISDNDYMVRKCLEGIK